MSTKEIIGYTSVQSLRVVLCRGRARCSSGFDTSIGADVPDHPLGLLEPVGSLRYRCLIKLLPHKTRTLTNLIRKSLFFILFTIRPYLVQVFVAGFCTAVGYPRFIRMWQWVLSCCISPLQVEGPVPCEPLSPRPTVDTRYWSFYCELEESLGSTCQRPSLRGRGHHTSARFWK